MSHNNVKATNYRFPVFEVDPACKTRGIDQPLAAEAATCAVEDFSEAYEGGFADGLEEGLQTERAALDGIAGMLKRITAELFAHLGAVSAAGRETVLQLCLEMAEVIVTELVSQRPEVSDAIYRKALSLALSSDWVKIKAHPEDHERISSLLDRKKFVGDNREGWELIADPFMRRGGCLLETEYGVIDARIEQQLNAVGADLKKVFRQSGNQDFSAERLLAQCLNSLQNAMPIKAYGHVSKVVGLVVEANGPAVQIGHICDISAKKDAAPVAAEVLGFRDKTVLMMPLEEIQAIGPGSRVVTRREHAGVVVGRQLLGRVIDGLGNPIDGLGLLEVNEEYPLYAQPINPLLRRRISRPLDLGVRAVNGLLTFGCGQRMGIFAGSGVGKSVLMGMIARNSSADVNVIALIGERGRELNEFIEKDLGDEGLKKSVVVVATSDHLPLLRVRGAFVATAIAEFFRDQGLTVNLMMDSLTRFAMAQREIGLALGEPPTTKGYTPSVFTLLPKLLERAGTSDHAGSITGLYTVLVEGDDMNEPIADAARSILDGHIVLTRELAAQNHYPAIDVNNSISRVMEDITDLKHRHNAGRFKELLATYRKAEDLINIGAYAAGSNPRIDRALAKIDRINNYLRQEMDQSVTFEESVAQLEKIMGTD